MFSLPSNRQSAVCFAVCRAVYIRRCAQCRIMHSASVRQSSGPDLLYCEQRPTHIHIRIDVSPNILCGNLQTFIWQSLILTHLRFKQCLNHFSPPSCRRGDYTMAMASPSPLSEAPSSPLRTPSRERARKRGQRPHHSQNGSPSQTCSQNLRFFETA